jgi:hypothetical protein
MRGRKWLLWIGVGGATLLTVAAAIGLLFVLLHFGTFNWKAEQLYDATVTSDYPRMKSLLSSGADVNFLFDGTTSSLAAAIENDDPKAAAILLQHGASTDTLSSHLSRLLESKEFSRKVRRELTLLGRAER